MDIDLLRAFVAVADTGGFTRAAERLGRTQSTVSLQIKRLEDGVGRRLMDRDTRSVALTPDGAVLLAYARRIISLAEEASARLAEPDVCGPFILAADDTAAELFAAAALARCLRRWPLLTPELRVLSTSVPASSLEASADVTLSLRLVSGQTAAGEDGEAIKRLSLVWVAAPGWRLDRTAPTPLIISGAEDPLLARAAGLTAMGLTWRAAACAPSLAARLGLARIGLGVVLAPLAAVGPDLDVLGPDSGLPPPGEADLVARRRPGLDGAPARVADEMIAALR